MSAASVFRNVCIRSYNGRYLTRLSGVKNNCKLCNCETVTRTFSTQKDRFASQCCRYFMSHVRVRHLRSSYIYRWLQTLHRRTSAHRRRVTEFLCCPPLLLMSVCGVHQRGVGGAGDRHARSRNTPVWVGDVHSIQKVEKFRCNGPKSVIPWVKASLKRSYFTR